MAKQSETDQLQARPATGHDFAPEHTQIVGQQQNGTLNTVDIISGGKAPAHNPAPLQLQRAPRVGPAKPPIGTAQLLSDESLVLNLEAETADGKTHGDGVLTVRPEDSAYGEIRQHIGEIHQGEIKFVSPWDDPVDQGKGQTPGGGPVKGDLTPSIDKTPGIDTSPGIDKTPDIDKAPGKDKTPGTDTPAGNGTTPGGVQDDKGKSGGPGGPKALVPGDVAITATATAPDPIVPASQAFDNTVATTYNAMSAQTRTIIAKKGATVVPTHHLTDALPELKGQTPRGWPKGATWDSVDGAWSGARNEIVVAEERKQLSNNQWVTSGRTAPVLRHEAGHAVDYAINMMSDLPAFKKAYDDDTNAMPAADKGPLSYFLQSGPGGREETAAEGVADREGGATGGVKFHNDFPKILQVINDTINKAVPINQAGNGGGSTSP